MADRKPPVTREEWAELPSEREVRRDRWIRQALIASLFIHALLVLFVILFVRYGPPPPPPAEMRDESPIPIVFSDQHVQVPAPTKPETNVVAEKDAEARSPGPEPPAPHGETSLPDPTLGRRGAPSPNVPPIPQPKPEPEPEKTEPERTPQERPVRPMTPETFEEKKRRVQAALGRIGSYGANGENGQGDWSGTPSSGVGFSWGGNAMQIESTSDVDWGPWAQRVQREVKDNWYAIMPVAARVGMKGVCVVRFRVQRDGTITDFELMESAGIPPLDDAVNAALLKMSSPLPPLPLPEDSDEESIRITYTFIYNLDSDREIRAWRRMNWARQKAGEGG